MQNDKKTAVHMTNIATYSCLFDVYSAFLLLILILNNKIKCRQAEKSMLLSIS